MRKSNEMYSEWYLKILNFKLHEKKAAIHINVMYKHIDFFKLRDAHLDLQKNSSFYKKIHLSILLIASSTRHLKFLICKTTSWSIPTVSLSSPARHGQPG